MSDRLFKPATTRRTYEDAVEQIADAIRAGDLHLGDRLPSERTLAAQMRISRPTLREAIKVLSDAGVIEVKPGSGGGMFVRSDLVPADLIDRSEEFRLSEVADVLQARRVLEPRVAQLAALHATDEDFEALQATIDLQRACTEDRDRFLQLDLRFHLGIARATRNQTVVALMRSLLRELEVARQRALRGTGEPAHAIEIHVRTLEAIKGGDPDAIEVAMDEHLSFLENVWQQETGQARLRRIPDFLLPVGERSGSVGGSRDA